MYFSSTITETWFRWTEIRLPVDQTTEYQQIHNVHS